MKLAVTIAGCVIGLFGMAQSYGPADQFRHDLRQKFKKKISETQDSTLQYKDGDTYVGVHEKGLRSGRGTLKTHGIQIVANWEQDTIVDVIQIKDSTGKVLDRMAGDYGRDYREALKQLKHPDIAIIQRILEMMPPDKARREMRALSKTYQLIHKLDFGVFNSGFALIPVHRHESQHLTGFAPYALMDRYGRVVFAGMLDNFVFLFNEGMDAKVGKIWFNFYIQNGVLLGKS